jgi:predicted acyltransferase
MLLFFTFSAGNHAATAIKAKNIRTVNLMRPVMVLFLLGLLLPAMVKALNQ